MMAHVGAVIGMGWANEFGRVGGVSRLDANVGREFIVMTMLGHATEELHAFQAANLDFLGNSLGCGLSGGFSLVHAGPEFAEDTAEDGGTSGIRTIGRNGDGGYGVNDSLRKS